VADASRAPCLASQSPCPESDAMQRLRVEDRQAHSQAQEHQKRIRELGEVVPVEQIVPVLQCREQIREVPTSASLMRRGYGGALGFYTFVRGEALGIICRKGLPPSGSMLSTFLSEV
jgi:hypothetical protein